MSHVQDRMPLQVPKIMGIVNLTEDSFSDGGKFLAKDAAIKHTKELISQGADIIDLGAESTRHGSRGIGADQQLERLIPIIKKLKQEHPNTIISVDTQDSIVAKEAIAQGVGMINDISALRNDENMAKLIASNPHVSIVLMHMQGRPQTMQDKPYYDDVLSEVLTFLKERIEYAQSHGIDKDRIIVDPGIGFGKNLQHNVTLLSSLKALKDLGVPVMLGASRKSFIDYITPASADKRVAGSLATTLLALDAKLDCIRVHDVFEHHQFIKVLAAVNGG